MTDPTTSTPPEGQPLPPPDHVLREATGGLVQAMAWWHALPGTKDQMREALLVFYGSPRAVPSSELAREMAEDYLRFIEWLMLTRPDARTGRPPAEAFADTLAGEAEEHFRAVVLDSKHAAWRVVESHADGASLADPTGNRIRLRGVGADASIAPGKLLLGRIYALSGPAPVLSPSLVAFESDAAGPGRALDEPAVQHQYGKAAMKAAREAQQGAEELAAYLRGFGFTSDGKQLLSQASLAPDLPAFLEAVMGPLRPHLAKLGSKAAFDAADRLADLVAAVWGDRLYDETWRGTPARAPEEDALPPESSEALALVRKLFEAIDAEDEEALPAVLAAGDFLDLVWDLWGWAGLRLVTGHDEPGAPETAEFLEDVRGGALFEVTWQPREGQGRGATFRLPPGGDGPRLAEATPALDDGYCYPAYDVAERHGAGLPWRSPAPDAVEAKLRAGVAARKYPLSAQVAIIHVWRNLRGGMTNRENQPEAWAAAVEGVYWQAKGRELPFTRMADAYGARKALVKERYHALAVHVPPQG